MVEFVGKQSSVGWDHLTAIPAELKQQVLEVKEILQEWQGQPFLEKKHPHKRCFQMPPRWAGQVNIWNPVLKCTIFKEGRTKIGT